MQLNCLKALLILIGLVPLSWGQAVMAQTVVEPTPQWIWFGDSQPDSTIYLRKSFDVTGKFSIAQIAASVDDECVVFLNGQQVLKSQGWQQFENADVTKQLNGGKNVIAIQAKNGSGAAGALAVLRIIHEGTDAVDVVTDTTWVGSAESASGWEQSGFDDSTWQPVASRGDLGASGLPWSKNINAKTLKKALSTGQEDEFLPVVAEHVQLPEGFIAEVLFEVPKSMGSWVSLSLDPQGRLIASDQGGAGLFLIVPGTENQPTTVQKLPVQLSGFQGLHWAFGALYGMINGGPNNGLHRLTDSDGDGLVDTSEFLIPIQGAGEHGPHAVIPSPDGKSLYICAGNHTKLPEGITGSLIPQNWDEDMILPRRWDANGHAAGILAPGGWIMKIDPEGKTREVVSMGYRNQYDIAFNADGELFTYDSDMEWDFGSPWYRPTRVNHATSGSEFGWRSGTGNWPAYYEDSLPETIDIGPGSPVGVTFGYGTKFPAKYQKALYLLDWTYSTIYAIHLTPKGSTYAATREEFAVGQPMQVTDAVVGPDGALYYTAGGRGTQSSLYRIRYVGTESTESVDARDSREAAPRAERHRLEAMHGHAGGDLDFIFSKLSSEDRFLRYAARIALEWQPIDSWKARALKGESLSPLGHIYAIIALARQGSAEDQSAALKALDMIDYASADETTRIALLRAYELVFIRLGLPEGEWREKLLAKFDSWYPSTTDATNAELCQLLVSLNSPTVVAKTLKLVRELGPEPIPEWGHLVGRNDRFGGTVGKLLADMPPTRAIHYIFALRNQKDHWTLAEREEYYKFFIEAAKKPGGNSYTKFLGQMRDDALLNTPPAEQAVLQELTSLSLVEAPPKVSPPKGPGRKWTREEALAVLEEAPTRRNFNRGRELYFATSCGKCHRLNGEGGAIGPDLSTAGKKFSMNDLLDAIIEPSKAISDQYASHQVITADGQVLLGRAMEVGDEIHVYTPDADAPPKVVAKKDIEEMQPSPISQMPVGLIETLNPDELKDLIAYLKTGADRRDKVYQK
ncbi:MAG TPA: c-type cytochrome [Planctomicrobium sp.]|nr:c-type cytochrome [Planctomicrobium sp.]